MCGRIGRIGGMGCIMLVACWIGGCGNAPAPVDEPGPESTPEETESPATSAFSVRHTMDPTYTAGDAMVVSVAMDYTGEEPVTALALEVSLPPRWQFAGIAGSLRPAVEPPAGTRDALTFLWIQIPAFPATVEYAVDIPADAAGPQTLSAQAIYRGLAGERQSPVDTVELAPAG